jgi:hypothetical protein
VLAVAVTKPEVRWYPPQGRRFGVSRHKAGSSVLAATRPENRMPGFLLDSHCIEPHQDAIESHWAVRTGPSCDLTGPSRFSVSCHKAIPCTISLGRPHRAIL